MLPVNSIREPRRHTRPARAKRALELLAQVQHADLPDAHMRWSAWKDVHAKIAQALDEETLHRFRADKRIGPHIAGGGEETYLHRLRDQFGQDTLKFFLSAHRETLCGDPQDLTCVEGAYVTRTSMRHLYHLAVLHRFCKNYYSSPVDVVEVGGGFGNLARLLVQWSLSRRYYIVDYPANLAIQYYFLTEFWEEGSVALWTGHGYLTGDFGSRICLVPPDAVPGLSSLLTRPAMLVSTMAMTEVPFSGQRYYLDHLKVDAVYVFGHTVVTAMAGGQQLGGYSELPNSPLFQYLASMCHTVQFTQGECFSELLGLVLDA